jgi:hypothetical protein
MWGMRRAGLSWCLLFCACGGLAEEVGEESGDEARSRRMVGINEFQAGRGGFVEILNGSDRAVELVDFAVDDGEGGATPVRFTRTLGPFEVVSIAFSGIGVASEDQVRLLDDQGGVFDALPNGWDPAGTSGVCFRRLFHLWQVRNNTSLIRGPCTPGELNTSVRSGDVVINEMRPGEGGFVEVMNTSGRRLEGPDVFGLRVDDGPGRNQPGLVSWRDDIFFEPGELIAFPYRGISGTSAETLTLTTTEGLLIDSRPNGYTAGSAVTGRCFGRLADRSWTNDPLECTQGTPNVAPPGAGGLLINELLAGSGGFIEIYNAGSTSVDLSGWTVDDVEGGGASPRAIANPSIGPGQIVAISYTGINRTSADFARLLDPSGREVDRIATNGAPGSSCWGRAQDGAAWSSTALASCTPGTSNGGGSTPTGCSARGGDYAGVNFTPAEECRALAFLNDARFSELYEIGIVPAETGYFCDATGCGQKRGAGWSSLADYDNASYGGGTPGRVAFESLRNASAIWRDPGEREDTVASVWARRESVANKQVIIERVYVERIARGFDPNDPYTQCAVVRDAPGAANYFQICAYRTTCHDGSCSGPTPPDLRDHVGQYVWVQGHFDAPGGRWGLHNLWLQPL